MSDDGTTDKSQESNSSPESIDNVVALFGGDIPGPMEFGFTVVIRGHPFGPFKTHTPLGTSADERDFVIGAPEYEVIIPRHQVDLIICKKGNDNDQTSGDI